MSLAEQEVRCADWVESSHSTGTGGNCVEVAVASEFAGARDSKYRERGALVFDRSQWQTFLVSLRG